MTNPDFFTGTFIKKLKNSLAGRQAIPQDIRELQINPVPAAPVNIYSLKINGDTASFNYILSVSSEPHKNTLFDENGFYVSFALYDPIFLEYITKDEEYNVDALAEKYETDTKSRYIYKDKYAIDCFHLLIDAPRPCLNLQNLLDEAGFNNVLGPIRTILDDKGNEILSVSEYFPNASDAKQLAAISLRDLFFSQECPHEAGADFTEESYRIGNTLGKFHAYSQQIFGFKELDIMDASERIKNDRRYRRLGISPTDLNVSSLLNTNGAMVVFPNANLESFMRSDVGWLISDFGDPLVLPVDSPIFDILNLLYSLQDTAEAAVSNQHQMELKRCSELAISWLKANMESLIKGYLANDAVSEIFPDTELINRLLASLGIAVSQ
jgi:hypothetical protein